MRVTYLLLVFLGVTPLAAQCPEITLTGTRHAAKVTKWRVAVKDHEADPTLSYRWTTQLGHVLTGQGSQEVEVAAEGNQVALMVEVGGLPKGCSNYAADSLEWIPPTPVLIEQFNKIGDITNERVKAVADQLRQDRTARGYVIVYGHPRARNKWRNLFSSQLSHQLRDLDVRVSYSEATAKVPELKVYLLPAGAEPPVP
jgi:hypothetical protein